MSTCIKQVGLMGMIVAMWGLASTSAPAAPFKKTTDMEGVYLLGTSSLQEFDYWVSIYPEYAAGCGFRFYQNGTVDIFDEVGGVGAGTYVRSSNGSRINVTLTQLDETGSQVTYKVYRIGNTRNWWGEVFIDGYLYGHFRMTVQ